MKKSTIVFEAFLDGFTGGNIFGNQAFLDGFTMAGLFSRLRRPGAPTQVFADPKSKSDLIDPCAGSGFGR
jgi:hypothetical protein